MGKREGAPYRQHTTEFKQEVIRLAESIGGEPAARQPRISQ